MRIRELRKVLDTKRSICNDQGYLAVGSAYVTRLISVAPETLKLSYALDPFDKGRKAISDAGLLVIWDKLTELIESGEIVQIMTGKDVIENPLPVWTVRNGVLHQSLTDKYGWPNVDDDGIMMYDNTHFSTKKQALAYGKRDLELAIRYKEEALSERKKELDALIERLNDKKKKLIQIDFEISMLDV